MSLTVVIYMLHYEEPIGDTSRPGMWAQHYVGSYKYSGRIDYHANGTSGVHIVKAFYDLGIKFEVVRKIPGDKTLERRIKNRGHFPDYCPRCSSSPWNGMWSSKETAQGEPE